MVSLQKRHITLWPIILITLFVLSVVTMTGPISFYFRYAYQLGAFLIVVGLIKYSIRLHGGQGTKYSAFVYIIVGIVVILPLWQMRHSLENDTTQQKKHAIARIGFPIYLPKYLPPDFKFSKIEIDGSSGIDPSAKPFVRMFYQFLGAKSYEDGMSIYEFAPLPSFHPQESCGPSFPREIIYEEDQYCPVIGKTTTGTPIYRGLYSTLYMVEDGTMITIRSGAPSDELIKVFGSLEKAQETKLLELLPDNTF